MSLKNQLAARVRQFHFIFRIEFVPLHRLNTHGVAVVGTPPTMILQHATTLGSNPILMGTRGRRGITRFVLGSVSHAVLHKMLCPVLAVRYRTD